MFPVFKQRRGMTLVELILAVLLVNVVILTGLSMEMGMRRVLKSTDVEIQLMGEAMPIVAMITKKINCGIGSSWNATVFPYSNIPIDMSNLYPTYRIRNDNNPDGRPGPGDLFAAFEWISDNNTGHQYELRYYRDDSNLTFYEVLSRRCTNFVIGPPSNDTSLIYVQLTKEPANTVIDFNNPRVDVLSAAEYRSTSVD